MDDHDSCFNCALKTDLQVLLHLGGLIEPKVVMCVIDGEWYRRWLAIRRLE